MEFLSVVEMYSLTGAVCDIAKKYACSISTISNYPTKFGLQCLVLAGLHVYFILIDFDWINYT